jgi:hypothetical protein
MPKYIVCYSEHSIREIAVTAKSAEEAERMVMDGDVEYDDSELLDAEVSSVDDVMEI